MIKNGLLLVLLFASHLVFSQVKFGLKLGVSFNNSSFESFDTKMLPSYSAGLVSEFGISEKLRLFVEPQFGSKGYENSSSAKTRISYIDFPVLINYSFSPKFSIETGPYIGFATSAKIIFQSDTYDINWFDNDIDFGATTGLRWSFVKVADLTFRYYHGLSNCIVNPPTLDPNDPEIDYSMYNRNLIISVTIFLSKISN